jgi:hypothetical protein
MVVGLIAKSFCAFCLVRQHYDAIRNELRSTRTQYIDMPSLPTGYNYKASAPIIEND